MTQAVVDPGVFVSALIGSAHGAPSRLVEALLSGEFEHVAAPMLFDELADVLKRDKFAAATADGRGDAYVALLRTASTLVSNPRTIEPVTRDADDDYLIAIARESGAELIVSVDKDLLSATTDALPVVRPGAFLDHLESTSRGA